MNASHYNVELSDFLAFAAISSYNNNIIHNKRFRNAKCDTSHVPPVSSSNLLPLHRVPTLSGSATSDSWPRSVMGSMRMDLFVRRLRTRHRNQLSKSPFVMNREIIAHMFAKRMRARMCAFQGIDSAGESRNVGKASEAAHKMKVESSSLETLGHDTIDSRTFDELLIKPSGSGIPQDVPALKTPPQRPASTNGDSLIARRRLDNRAQPASLSTRTTSRRPNNPDEHSGATAEELNQELERLDSDDPEDVRIAAKSAMRHGKLELARDLFKHCVEIDPSNGKAWQEYAKLEGILGGGPRKSIQILRQAQEVMPENPYFFQSLGLLQHRMGSLQSARDSFRKGLSIDSSRASLYAAWGKVEAIEKNVELARELFETGLELDPTSTRVYHSWAHLEEKVGNVDAAVELLRKGLEYDSTNTYLWQALGQIALGSKDYERARECFQHALYDKRENTDLPSVFAYDSYGRMEYTLGNREKAKQIFLESLDMFPKDVRPMQCLALIEMKMGNMDEARVWTELALRTNQRDSFFWCLLALIEATVGNIPRARALFKRGSELNSKDAVIWNAWSYMEWQEGNIITSEKLLRRYFVSKYDIRGDFCILAETMEDSLESSTFARLLL